MLFPTWVAVIVQVPAPLKVAVFPFTVQTLALAVVKLTGKPELAVAPNVIVPPTLWKPVMAGNEIVCAAGLTVIVAVTAGAAAYVAPSPGCDATIMQVPSARKLAVAGAVVPDKVQIPGVTELRLTDKPELAAAVSSNGFPSAAALGGAKAIVCKIWPVVTVAIAAGLVTPLKLATMLVVPADTLVAKPVALIVAVAGVPEFQVAKDVTFGMAPSL